jgi:Carbohydrate-selective porin, OprB family
MVFRNSLSNILRGLVFTNKKYTLGVRIMQHMLKFKSGIFSWSLLSLIIICVTTPAFAQSQTAAQDQVTPQMPVVDGAAAKSDVSAKSEPPQSGSLAVSDKNVQILKTFNDRYNCGIANIEKEISRADFANNIAVCLSSTEVKLAQNPTAVPVDDLMQLKDMTSQFMDEVSYLGNRVETLEKKLAAAQKTSTFSTTTKLAGEVIVGLTSFSSQTRTGDTNTGNTVFTNRVRLNFDTTFTGKDRLRTRLQSRNTSSLSGGAITGTNTTRLGYDGDEQNTTNLSLLQYTLPVFDNSRLIIETVGSEFNENMYTFNPLLTSSGSGSISRFGRYNPVYRQSGDGAAATLDYRFSPEFSAAVGYAVPGAGASSIANNPNNSAGIFGGNYAGIVQLRYQASPELDLGLSYARSYHSNGAGVTGSTGSSIANTPFGAVPTVANHYSFLASAKVSPGFILSGWVGLTNANVESGGASTGSADIFNAALTAAFTDVGGKGNTLGFVVGIPPRVTGTTASANLTGVNGRSNPDTTLHLEALYKIKVSDNLDITPGILLITSPESAPNTDNRGSEFVGTVRTTFKF